MLEATRRTNMPTSSGVFQLGPEGGGMIYVGCCDVLLMFFPYGEYVTAMDAPIARQRSGKRASSLLMFQLLLSVSHERVPGTRLKKFEPQRYTLSRLYN